MFDEEFWVDLWRDTVPDNWVGAAPHEVIAAFAARVERVTRDNVAEALRGIIPDLHEEHEECLECWTIRTAIRLADMQGE